MLACISDESKLIYYNKKDILSRFCVVMAMRMTFRSISVFMNHFKQPLLCYWRFDAFTNTFRTKHIRQLFTKGVHPVLGLCC